MRYSFVVIAGIMILFLAGCAPRAKPAVEKGKYLTTVGACVECHTPRVGGDERVLDRAKLLAGGQKFVLPFGTVYSKNITPDKETGIGKATREQIEKAVREGVGIDDRPLVPPMRRYNGLSAEDINAIIDYVQSVPPISHKPPASELKAPRQSITPPSGPRGPEKAPTAGVDRGNYLANQLMGCGDCHTPMERGKPDRSKFLAGVSKRFGPIHAPNITPDKETGIGNWTDAEITRSIKEGINKEGRPIMIMPSVTAYKDLTDEDMKAIAAYLWSITPVKNKIPANILPPR